MAGGDKPRRRRGTTALCVVLAVAGGLVGLVLVGRNSSNNPRQTATRTLLALPAPAGATKDPYGSACTNTLAPVYCVTSTTLTPEQLIASSVPLIAAHGGSETRPMMCRSDAPGGDNCTMEVSLGGDPAVLTAGWASLDGATGAVQKPKLSQLAVLLAGHQKATPARALLSWTQTSPLPAAWKVQPPCTDSEPSGCFRYDSTGHPTVVPESRGSAEATVRASLTKAGYALMVEPCPSEAPTCSIGASRYRTVGGRDPISVEITLRSVAQGHTSVDVTVSPSSYGGVST